MKYKDWLIEWLELYQRQSVKTRTYKAYSDIVYKRLMPNLGYYEIEDIDGLLLQKYVSELSCSGNMRNGKGLAPNSVNSIILVIYSSLSMACTLGLCSDNAADKIKRPKVREKSVFSFSVEEQKKIENAVLSDKRDKMFGIILTLYTGLRIGELLALEWDDIDLNHAEIYVTKSCYDGRDEKGRMRRIVGTPKTDSSKRVVPIPKQLIPLIRDAKKKSKSKYVVSNGEESITGRSYQRSFELLLKKIKIPHQGFHSLRHTFATRAIECGMDVKSLSEILGHKNPNITLKRYVHSFMNHKKELMNRLGKLF